MLHVLTTLFVNFTTLFRPCQHPAGPRTRNKQIVNCANPALSQFPTGTTWIQVPQDTSSLSLSTLSIPLSTLSISLSTTSISLSSALSCLTISSQSHANFAGAPLHCPCPTSQPPHCKRTNQPTECFSVLHSRPPHSSSYLLCAFTDSCKCNQNFLLFLLLPRNCKLQAKTS